ncbi:MAG: ribosome maturation factor RimM [Nitrospinota bacterium]|nr:ribosome maturation factor RimM [Nitrospinota bacterium]
MTENKNKIEVGVIVKPHGYKGLVKFKPWLDYFEDYSRVESVFLEELDNPSFKVISVVPQGKKLQIWKLDGVDSLESAELISGKIVSADRKFLKGECEGVFYWEDFEGYKVVNEEGTELGVFTDLIGAGGNDVLVLQVPSGEEIMIPAVKEFLLGFDADKWVVRVPLT